FVVGGATTAGIPIKAQNNTAPFTGAPVLPGATRTEGNLVQLDPSIPAHHPPIPRDPPRPPPPPVFQRGPTRAAAGDPPPTQPGWTLNGQATSFTNSSTTPVTTITADTLG